MARRCYSYSFSASLTACFPANSFVKYSAKALNYVIAYAVFSGVNNPLNVTNLASSCADLLIIDDGFSSIEYVFAATSIEKLRKEINVPLSPENNVAFCFSPTVSSLSVG